jgi:hypothetical protein
MATSEAIQFTFTSSDGKSLILAYNPSGNTLVNLQIQLNGVFYSWSTVEDFKDFLANVIACGNILHSPSGSGAGYVAATVGIDGADSVTD